MDVALDTPPGLDPAAFARDGIACVRGVAGSRWMAPLREAVAWAMANPSPVAVDYGAPGTPRFFHDVNVWRRHDTIRDFALNGPAVEVARALLGAKSLRYYGDHVMVKEPGTVDLPVPWHQDLGYVRVTGWQFCSVWVALDVVTQDSGGMRFVRGSHRGPTYKPVKFQTGESVKTDEYAEAVPDIDANPARFPVVHFDLAPGDCTVHHANTLHASGGNRTPDRMRRAVILRYAGEDARYTVHQQALKTADPGLKVGEPLGGEHYPQVWPPTR